MLHERVLSIQDGEIATDGSWVYAWVRSDNGAVVYVGATGLPLDVRAWLHLNDTDPKVGRVRSAHPEALAGKVQVRGFRLPTKLDRQAVKQAVIALLDELPVQDRTDQETINAALEIASRLSEPPTPA